MVELIPLIGPALVALIALGGPILVYVQNKRQAKTLEAQNQTNVQIETAKLDGMAIERAKTFYESMMNQLEAQATKLREIIEGLENDLAAERLENNGLRQKIRELENEADKLEDEIFKLKQKIERLTVE